jgi:phosphatidylserine/phosphatidylglycerophosphate/cardiolipin synthase-like enzyme
MTLVARAAGAGEDSSADRAIAALFTNAQRQVRAITPNLNDDGALAALARATATADVDLVLSRGFNDNTEALPGQGGTNDKNVPRLASMAANRCRLHIRWFARDPGVAVQGNVVGANHAKWASADGQVMILGSQNLDTQSWKHSREVGVAVDDAATTAGFDALFDEVFARGPVAYECQ